MRSGLLFLTLILVASCRKADQGSATGWHYRPEHGAYSASLTYDFGDSGKTFFAGSCSGQPAFWLGGGDYQGNPTDFTLTVDDKSWTLPIRFSEHGGGIWVDSYEPATAIATAKRRIVFQIGDWRRELQPGPVLAKFVSDCR